MNVDSIVIHIVPHPTPVYSPAALEDFERINRALFAQPRKALRNSLKKTLSKELVRFLEVESGVDFGLRPAKVSLREVVDLVTALEKWHAKG